ncbi:hypothetical protein HDV00_000752, partial [Rhizophlyctis rosea]
EIRVKPEDLEKERYKETMFYVFEGYTGNFAFAEKPGYSGVATLVRNELKGRLGGITEVFKETPGGKILETWEGRNARGLSGETDADVAVSVRPGLKSGWQAWERESVAELEKAGFRDPWRELHPKGGIEGFTCWMPERNARVFHRGMRFDMIYYWSIPKHVGIQLKGCERFDLGGSDHVAVVGEFRVSWRIGRSDYKINLLRAYHLGEPEVGNGKTVEAVAGKKGEKGLDLRGPEEVEKICGANVIRVHKVGDLPINRENLDLIRRIYAGHHEEFVNTTEMPRTFTGVTEMEPHLKMQNDDKLPAPKYRRKSPAETQLEIEYRDKMMAAGKLEPAELPIVTAGNTVIAWKGDKARITFQFPISKYIQASFWPLSPMDLVQCQLAAGKRICFLDGAKGYLGSPADKLYR